jgi:hypothetical protein
MQVQPSKVYGKTKSQVWRLKKDCGSNKKFLMPCHSLVRFVITDKSGNYKYVHECVLASFWQFLKF